MAGEFAIEASCISKTYKIWSSPAARLRAPLLNKAAELPLVPRAVAGYLKGKASRSYRTFQALQEVSNEMAAAVPPCGRFGANAAWYRLSLLTYNLLSAMKSLALPPELSSARPKRLRFSVFTLAGRIVSHAGRLVVRVGAEAEALAGLIAARLRLAHVRLLLASS